MPNNQVIYTHTTSSYGKPEAAAAAAAVERLLMMGKRMPKTC
jgi:hypothetical protein